MQSLINRLRLPGTTSMCIYVFRRVSIQYTPEAYPFDLRFQIIHRQAVTALYHIMETLMLYSVTHGVNVQDLFIEIV